VIPITQTHFNILIRNRIDTTSSPNRNIISLTRRGKELSRRLEEITGLLSPE